MAYLNQSEDLTGKELIWKDRKHWAWFPFSFTRYEISDGRLHIDRGFFKSVSDETLLYRIIDLKLERTLGQKLFGTGTICLRVRVDADKEIHLENIKHPKEVKNVISHIVEASRTSHNVVGKEFYNSESAPMRGHNEDDCPCCEEHHHMHDDGPEFGPDEFDK